MALNPGGSDNAPTQDVQYFTDTGNIVPNTTGGDNPNVAADPNPTFESISITDTVTSALLAGNSGVGGFLYINYPSGTDSLAIYDLSSGVLSLYYPNGQLMFSTDIGVPNVADDGSTPFNPTVIAGWTKVTVQDEAVAWIPYYQ